MEPDGDWWSTWLALAGRGWGKSEAGARWVRKRVHEGARHIALIAETQKDLEEVMVKRILSVHHPDERPKVRFKPVKIEWPNGAIALGYNGTEPNQLRGPEFDTAWVDELAKYRRAQETWDMLQFTMRLGELPRTMVTTTPRAIQLIKDIMASKSTATVRGRTLDNAGNLPASFIREITAKYAGTRLGRQELDAEILDDVPGALWSFEDINRSRERAGSRLERIVVAVDPPVTSGENADECGIIVAGVTAGARDNTAEGFILEDRTVHMKKPDEWAKEAVAAYEHWGANCIVAEINQGGEMVESVIRHVDPKVAYKPVRAKVGKVARAEPVSALYEQGRVHHDGTFKKLEDQMCQFKVGGLDDPDASPDRVDALVYALTELMIVPVEAPSLLDVL